MSERRDVYLHDGSGLPITSFDNGDGTYSLVVHVNGLVDPVNAVDAHLLNGTNYNMAVDGSVTPVEFSYDVPTGKYLELTRIMFGFEATTAFSAELFANLPALTNGIDLVCDNTTFVNWKTNSDIKLSMYDTDAPAAFAKIERQLNGRFTMRRAFGGDLRVNNAFKFVINDDLSSLVAFQVKIQGVLRDV